MSGLRAAARVKPVIVMKSGATRPARARRCRTPGRWSGPTTCSMRRAPAGVVRVHTVDQLVAAAQALSSNVPLRGDRLAVITNGGGPGVMAADRATDS